MVSRTRGRHSRLSPTSRRGIPARGHPAVTTSYAVNKRNARSLLVTVCRPSSRACVVISCSLPRLLPAAARRRVDPPLASAIGMVRRASSLYNVRLRAQRDRGRKMALDRSDVTRAIGPVSAAGRPTRSRFSRRFRARGEAAREDFLLERPSSPTVGGEIEERDQVVRCDGGAQVVDGRSRAARAGGRQGDGHRLRSPESFGRRVNRDRRFRGGSSALFSVANDWSGWKVRRRLSCDRGPASRSSDAAPLQWTRLCSGSSGCPATATIASSGTVRKTRRLVATSCAADGAGSRAARSTARRSHSGCRRRRRVACAGQRTDRRFPRRPPRWNPRRGHLRLMSPDMPVRVQQRGRGSVPMTRFARAKLLRAVRIHQALRSPRSRTGFRASDRFATTRFEVLLAELGGACRSDSRSRRRANSPGRRHDRDVGCAFRCRRGLGPVFFSFAGGGVGV